MKSADEPGASRPIDARDLAPGDAFGNGYQVVRRMKAGGMGAIYEVVHLVTRRRRALKVLLPALVADPAQRERFTREATITAEVKSEHLVEVFDAGIDAATGMPFLVMELLQGEDLGEVLARRGTLPAGEVVDLLGQAARAMDRMHAAGVVHRDLKPGNVFLSVRDDGSPWVKLLDFGVSKAALAGEEGATNTSALGTPLYMAPEQMRTKQRVGPATDHYALAHLAYRMLAGAAYWDEERRQAESVIALMVVIARGPREAATARAARRGVTLSPAFDPWFARAAAARPHHRYAAAREMIADLAAALDEAVPFSRVHSLPPPAPEPVPAATANATQPSPGEPPAQSTPATPATPPTPTSTPEPTLGSSSQQTPAPATLPSRRGSRWRIGVAAAALLGIAGLGFGARVRSGARGEAGVAVLTDLPAPASTSAAAVAAYRTGLQEARDGLLEATGFQRAIELDPNLAEAYLQSATRGVWGLPPGSAHFHEAQLRREALSPRDRALLDVIEPVVARDPADWVEAARRAARATERFPKDAQLWVVRSYLDHAESHEAAHADAVRALALDPSYGEALANDAEALLSLGREPEARRRLDACFELVGSAYTSCSWVHTELDAQVGDCAALAVRARRAVASGGQPVLAHDLLARALAARGAPPDAVREALRAEVPAFKASERRELELGGEVRLSLLSGDFAAAERGAREMLDLVARERLASRHGVPSLWLAQALAESGRAEEAGQVARAFLDRSDGWDPEPQADEYAMSQDGTIPLLALARAAGQIPAAEVAARRDAWLRGWTARTLPTLRPSLWMHAYPPLAGTEAEARAALEARSGPLPPHRPNTLADAGVGHAFLLAGRPDEAVAVLEEATRSCRALEYPVLHTHAHDWLGQAREAKGDRAGACAAYGVVLSRWGRAVPRSITADHARARVAALGCEAR